MRRTTSALTTMILGAALAASVVSAQQILPSPGARRGDSTAPASDSTPAPGSTSPSSTEAGADSTADPIVGMAATRGARYLLRNGLDYINYQEYERALKYLREAETRQKELSKAERLSLKQAIERAQRGLREAVGSDTPYALSLRSRRPWRFRCCQAGYTNCRKALRGSSTGHGHTNCRKAVRGSSQGSGARRTRAKS